MSTCLWKIGMISDGVWSPAVQIPVQVAFFDEIASMLPDGAYTTLCTFHKNMALNLESHFMRLEETSRLLGQPIRLDRSALRAAIRGVVLHSEMEEMRIRLYLDLTTRVGDLYIAACPMLRPSPEDYKTGVRVITKMGQQRRLPLAKVTSFIEKAEKLRKDLPPEIHETILVAETGELLEGLSSNLFCVRAGQIYTAGEGVLAGTTRELVINEIDRLGMPLHLQGVKLSAIEMVEEAFITSASRAVLAVRRIDDREVLAGAPGKFTQRIMEAYQSRINGDLEEI